MKQKKRFLILDKNTPSVVLPAILKGDRMPAVLVPVLLAFILFVISVSKFNITAVIVYSAFPLFAIIALRLPVKVILSRLMLLSPFILIMAAANPVIDQRPFLSFGNCNISAGFVSGSVIIVKSLVTITGVIVFSFCVPFYLFCKVLRNFRVPEVFVTQLMLLHRYSFLLADEAQALQKARNLRSFGKKGKDLFTTAKLIGSLLIRTSGRADRIYRAMVARGFDGEIDKKNHIRFRVADWLLITGILFIFTIIRMIF
jgi:cobalt/nickel transport system permease protein